LFEFSKLRAKRRPGTRN